jgi:peptide-methionine (S)-S-oxide reductase
MASETIVFGGGCFWCTEAVFKMLRGVESVAPGYAGGSTPCPTYEEVSTGTTGHAEVVEVTFDPDIVSLDTLFTIFFASHDPTTVDRQGSDIGPQYRSVLFYTTDAQREAAERFINTLNESSEYGAQIVTQVEPLTEFYEAENYHRDYFAKNPTAPYCQVVINPKLKKVQEQFAELLTQEAAKHSGVI